MARRFSQGGANYSLTAPAWQPDWWDMEVPPPEAIRFAGGNNHLVTTRQSGVVTLKFGGRSAKRLLVSVVVALASPSDGVVMHAGSDK